MRTGGRDAYVVEPMEPRILLSADALGIDAGALDDNPDAADHAELTTLDLRVPVRDAATPPVPAAPAPIDPATVTVGADTSAADCDDCTPELPSLTGADAVSEGPREIVFIDPDVPDTETLLADLAARDTAGLVQVHVLDTGSDGVAQIAAVLAGAGDIDAVHILSHGAAGEITLGTTTLSQANLGQHAAAIAGWSDALTADADILIYGCDVASTAHGESFVGALAALTGADVAASDDATGSAEKGGDWHFEYRIGTIESSVTISELARQTWSGTLGAITVTTTSDVLDGDADTSSLANLFLNPGSDGFVSLREAIAAANTDTGADTIYLQAGTYDMDRLGTGDTTGDFDIRDDLSIIGVGPDQTSIDDPIYRRFDIHADTADITVSFSNLQISRGYSAFTNGYDGGAIRINNDAFNTTVNIDNVWFTGNHADGSQADGGAIYNDGGNLTITNSLFYGNTTEQKGGAIYNSSDGTLTLTNVTLSNNYASGSGALGGGLYNEGTATLRHVTIAYNGASTDGGGIWNSGTLDIGNSIVANNTGSSGPDVFGTLASSGSNIFGNDADGGGFHGTDQRNVDPLLDAYAPYGGALYAYGLEAGSPALDAADPGMAPADDQRGFSRDGAPDIGAYEAGTGNYVADHFGAISFANDDGTVPWANDWQEVDESDGANATHIRVKDYFGDTDYELRIEENGNGAWRETDISAYASAILTFDYARENMDAGDAVVVYAQAGGASGSTVITDAPGTWEEVLRFDGPADDTDWQSASVDISAYIAADTRILFVAENVQGSSEFSIDSVQIALSGTSNPPPVAAPDGFTVAEGATKNLDLATNDTDASGLDLASITIVSGPSRGTIDAINSDGTVDYTHDGSESTSDSFTYTIDDMLGETSNTVTVSLTISPQNDEQVVATNTGTTVAEGSTSTTITTAMLETTDAEQGAAALTYTVTTVPANGTLYLDGTALSVSETFTQADIDAGRLTYDHDGSETTSDSFDFSVDDGTGTASTDTFAITVTPQNDEQVVATNTGTTVAEGSTGTTITTAMLETTDTEQGAAALTYTVTTVPANGTLYLDGTALSVSETFTQADIDAGRLTYDHDGSETTTDSFDFSVDDGAGTASTDTFAITVTPQNDEQVIATNIGTTVAEGSTGTTITTAMLETSDVEQGAAALTYTVTTAPANGTLYLDGTALSASETFTQADIDAGRLTYDHDGSETTTDSFDFSVDDGAGTASTDTFAITVTPQNDEQVIATNIGTTVAEGSTGTTITTAMLETTDAEQGAAALTYTVTTVPANGTLYLDGVVLANLDTFTQADIDAGRLTYDHDGSETTTDSFDFSVDDGAGTASTDTFAITVTPQNDEQVIATNTGTTVAEGSTGTTITTAMLETTDAEQGAAALTYTVTTVPTNGMLYLDGTALSVSETFTQADIDAGRLTYDHNGSETTADSFDFSVDDGTGTASTDTFAITVTPQNDEQVLVNNTGVTVAQGGTGNAISATTLLTTDVDNSAAEIVYTLQAAPLKGTLYLNSTALSNSDTFTQDDIDAGRITYDHDGSASTSDSFGFSVDDGDGSTSNAVYNITVTLANVAPVAAPDGFTVAEGATKNLDLAGNDTDPDGSLDLASITIVSGPAHGTIDAVNPDGTVDYTHDGSETTSDSFTYTIDDTLGATSNTVTASLTISPQNDEQVVATNTGTTVAEGSTGTAITTAMLETTDVEQGAAALTYTVTTVPANGTLYLDGVVLNTSDTFTQADIDAGRLTYDHDGSEATADSFDFGVDDGTGTDSTGTFAITVAPQNDEQVIATNTGTTVAEGSTGTTITTAMLETSDVEQGAAALTYTVTTIPANGTLYLDGTALSASDTFTQADIDAGRLTYDHDGSETTADSFDFSVDDGTGIASTDTFAITVTPQNDEQVIATNTGTTVAEGSTGTAITTAMLETTDVEQGAAALTYTVTTVPANGTLYLDGVVLNTSDTFTQADIDAGRLTYDHDGSETTADGFDFSVDDDAGTASTDTFAITVTPQNDEQVVSTNTGTTVAEGSTGTMIMTAMLETTDAEQGTAALTYTVTGIPANGTLYLDGVVLTNLDTFTQADIDAGRLTYDHDGSETTSDSFDFSVDDGAGIASTDTFAITVTPQNDEQVIATNTGTTVAEGSTGTAITTAMLETTDVEQGAAALTYTVTTVPANGTLYLDGVVLNTSDTFTQADIDAGRLTYDHDGSETTADGFDFSVDDGAGTASTDTFAITVTPQNDAPVITKNTMVLNSGERVVLDSDMLSATDADDPAAHLLFSLSNVTGGHFELVSNPGHAVTSFTQGQITAAQVVFVDDGDRSLPGYAVSVDDGAAGQGPVTAEVAFAPPPVILVDIPDVNSIPDLGVTPSSADQASAGSSSEAEDADEANDEEGNDEDTDETEAVAFSETGDEVAASVDRDDGVFIDAQSLMGKHRDAAISDAAAQLQALLAAQLEKKPALAAVAAPNGELLDELTAERSVSQIVELLSSREFGDSMDRMRDDVADATRLHHAVVGSGVAVSTGLSVGYVAWLVRGGLLLSTVLSSLPAWQFVDPLPVLARTSMTGDEDPDGDNDDSLESIIEDRSTAATDGSTPTPAAGDNPERSVLGDAEDGRA